MIDYTKYKGLSGTNITTYNYKQFINKIGISKLPPALLKGHQFYSKNIDLFDTNTSIADTINDYLTDLNNYVAALPKNKQDAIFFEDNGYSQNKFTGSKYKLTQNLKTAEIAKLVKKELDILHGDYAKFSVTSDLFAGGSSIRVEILNFTKFNPFTEEYTQSLLNNEPYEIFRGSYNRQPAPKKTNEQFEKFINEVNKVLNQYNFDDSDSQTDYYHVNYYSSVVFDEMAFKKIHYPNHPEVIAHVKYWADVESKKKKSSEVAAQRKGIFKKDEIVYFLGYLHESWHKYKLPLSEFYLVKIIKSPNGRSAYNNNYLVRILMPVNSLKESTLNFYKKIGRDKNFIQHKFGTFNQSDQSLSVYEHALFSTDLAPKQIAILKAKQLAAIILK